MDTNGFVRLREAMQAMVETIRLQRTTAIEARERAEDVIARARQLRAAAAARLDGIKRARGGLGKSE
jgi:hypothetical protein